MPAAPTPTRTTLQSRVSSSGDLDRVKFALLLCGEQVSQRRLELLLRRLRLVLNCVDPQQRISYVGRAGPLIDKTLQVFPPLSHLCPNRFLTFAIALEQCL